MLANTEEVDAQDIIMADRLNYHRIDVDRRCRTLLICACQGLDILSCLLHLERRRYDTMQNVVTCFIPPMKFVRPQQSRPSCIPWTPSRGS